MPKDVNEGGNILDDDETQIIFPLSLREERIPQMKAEEEENDSFDGQMNS